MSNATLRTALAALTPTGVARVYDHPPNDVEVADLPAMWPDGFSADHDFQTYSGPLVRVERTADLVVAVKPLGMATNDERQDARITIADALADELDDDDLTGFQITGLSIKSDSVTINGVAYVGLIATVTVREVI